MSDKEPEGMMVGDVVHYMPYPHDLKSTYQFDGRPVVDSEWSSPDPESECLKKPWAATIVAFHEYGNHGYAALHALSPDGGNLHVVASYSAEPARGCWSLRRPLKESL